MTMRFVRIDTDDHDTRWVNLQQISRVTVGNDESNHPFLIAMFSDGSVDNGLKIVGRSETNRTAIKALETALNDFSV